MRLHVVLDLYLPEGATHEQINDALGRLVQNMDRYFDTAGENRHYCETHWHAWEQVA